MSRVLLVFMALLAVTFSQCKTSTVIKDENVIVNREYKLYVKDPSNGEYILTKLNQKDFPAPAQGVEPMLRDMYSAMNYPASARDKGIQGTVVLVATVDRNGHVQSVEVLEGVSDDLDNAAIEAYRHATAQGYQPFYYAEAIVGFRLEVPVNFRLR